MDMVAFAAQALVALLLLLGLAGVILPFLPGTPLIFGGILLHAWMTDYSPIDGHRLLILAALAILAQVLGWPGCSASSGWGAACGPSWEQSSGRGSASSSASPAS